MITRRAGFERVALRDVKEEDCVRTRSQLGDERRCRRDQVTLPQCEGQKLLRQALGAAAKRKMDRTIGSARWSTSRGVKRGVGTRGGRAEHSRILEHVLATNEASTVVEHYAALLLLLPARTTKRASADVFTSN